MKKCFIIIICIASMLLCSCSGQNEDKTSKAIYIYMCGSSLESRSAAAVRNIQEMLNEGVPKGTTVILETGGTYKWHDYDIDSEKLSRYKITGNNIELIETADDGSMGKSSTLTDFLTFCKEKYPADNTGVILWDHGGGSIRGVCFDEKYNMDALTLTELDEAFRNTDAHYDWVGFDACLMANYETATVMSQYADNMIASEELEPYAGWDYGAIVRDAGKASFYNDVLDAYESKCKNNKRTAYTLSCINLKEYGKIQSAFDAFCQNYLLSAASDNLQGIVQAAENTMNFGNSSKTQTCSNMIDLSMFASSLNCTELSESIINAIKCTNGIDRDGATGLSFFYPLSNTEDARDYPELSSIGDYRNFLDKYYISRSDEELIKFIDNGSDANGELHFQLSEDSLKYVKSIDYKLYQADIGEDEEQKMVLLGYDSDVIDDGEGGYTTSFEGKWLSINGTFASCETIDKVGNITTFISPVKCNQKPGNIHFTYDISNKEFRVLGFVPTEENGTQGRLNSINDGDEIVLLQEAFDENYEGTLSETSTFIVKDELKLSVEQLPEGMYQFCAIVTDIYGKEYSTNPIVSNYINGKLIMFAL